MKIQYKSTAEIKNWTLLRWRLLQIEIGRTYSNIPKGKERREGGHSLWQEDQGLKADHLEAARNYFREAYSTKPKLQPTG